MDDSCCNKEICENCIHSAYYLSKRICLLKDKLVNDEDPKCDDFKNGYFVGTRTMDDIRRITMITDEEAHLYEKLTGEDPNNVSIIRMESYLDGYKKGIEELEKIKLEIDALYGVYLFKERLVNETDVIQILDRHIKENKE